MARGRYGTEVGDVWTMEGSEVGDQLAAGGRIGIWEVFEAEGGGVEERCYSVRLDTSDPELQALIVQAREGDAKLLAEEASRN